MQRTFLFGKELRCGFCNPIFMVFYVCADMSVFKYRLASENAAYVASFHVSTRNVNTHEKIYSGYSSLECFFFYLLLNKYGLLY